MLFVFIGIWEFSSVCWFAVHILHRRLWIKKRTWQISVLLYEWTREKHNTGCVFVTHIHPSRRWMSGSFESVWWNAFEHRLNPGLYSHPKVLGGMESELMLTPKEKAPLPEVSGIISSALNQPDKTRTSSKKKNQPINEKNQQINWPSAICALREVVTRVRGGRCWRCSTSCLPTVCTRNSRMFSPLKHNWSEEPVKTVQTPSSPGTSHKLMTLHHDFSHTSTLDDDN